MKKLKFLRNKYILTSIIFGAYILFLDDADIFDITHQKIKLSKLKQEKNILTQKLNKTKSTLIQLDDYDALESYAREKKFFKRDNEDIFVIVQDDEE